VIDHRPAASRPHTRIDWLDSWHCFSFGHHYDPANTHHGLLLVSNDDRVSAGGGFGTHPHRDMEIVTWVLEGELAHRDSEGNEGAIHPGLAQRMSAGTGIRHSEMNASATRPVHFVQMWVPPDTEGIAPGYEQRPVGAELDTGALVKVAGAQGDSAVHIHQRDAALHVARLSTRQSVDIPVAAHVHVFLASGEATLGPATSGAVVLAAGDAVRLTDEGGLTLTATAEGSEVLIWATA